MCHYGNAWCPDRTDTTHECGTSRVAGYTVRDRETDAVLEAGTVEVQRYAAVTTVVQAALHQVAPRYPTWRAPLLALDDAPGRRWPIALGDDTRTEADRAALYASMEESIRRIMALANGAARGTVAS